MTGIVLPSSVCDRHSSSSSRCLSRGTSKRLRPCARSFEALKLEAVCVRRSCRRYAVANQGTVIYQVTIGPFRPERVRLDPTLHIESDAIFTTESTVESIYSADRLSQLRLPPLTYSLGRSRTYHQKHTRAQRCPRLLHSRRRSTIRSGTTMLCTFTSPLLASLLSKC